MPGLWAANFKQAVEAILFHSQINEKTCCMNRLARILITCFIVLLGVLKVGPFLIPIPDLEGTYPPQQLADADSRFIEVNDLQVHYKVEGQGEPAILLMHGFLSNLFSWREVLSPLSETRTVIAFDRPAFGLTERPVEWSGKNPYSPDTQVELVVGLMDKLGLEQVVLVGNSAGGTLAAMTTLYYPQRVQALILVDPAIYSQGGTSDWIRPFLKTPQMRRLGPLFVRQVKTLGRDFGRLAWHNPERITEEIWEGYTKPLQAQNWDKALWEFILASRTIKLEPELAECQLPVLVITGEDDRIIPMEQSMRLASQLPNAEFVILPNCGHIPQEECPQDFLNAVNTFLNGVY